MTDQQAPGGIWIDLEAGEFFLSCVDDHVVEYVRADLLEAAEKRYQNKEDHAFCLSRDRDYCRKRAEKAEAERDQALAREASLKSSYDEERKALVENIRLRVRIKELEREANDAKRAAVGFEGMYNTACNERDQALAASAAREIAMRARAAVCAYHKPDVEPKSPYNRHGEPVSEDLEGFAGQVALHDAWQTAQDILALPLSPDGQQALNEMLADAWDEGQDTYREWPLEKNPYRKDET